MSTIVRITDLRANENGTVVSINGGFGMVRRLNALGIHEGKTITKVSAQWMHGPVIIRIGHTDLAIGHGMAGKIMVSRDKGNSA